MNAEEIIAFIRDAKKKTPVKAYVKVKKDFETPGLRAFGAGDKIVFGEWTDVEAILAAHAEDIEDVEVEYDRRNSAVPLLDTRNIRARIEPGAIIRDRVEIGDGAVIMMGAIINIGAVIGEGTMIDMGAVLGGRATVGKNCHIGAGAVLAGVVEPASATPVIRPCSKANAFPRTSPSGSSITPLTIQRIAFTSSPMIPRLRRKAKGRAWRSLG